MVKDNQITLQKGLKKWNEAQLYNKTTKGFIFKMMN